MKKAPPQTSPGKQPQEEHDHPKEAWFLHVRLEKVGSARFHLLPRVLGATAGRHRLEWPKSAKAQDCGGRARGTRPILHKKRGIVHGVCGAFMVYWTKQIEGE